MRIWNGIDRFVNGPTHVVASIGNYDGVHLGHREILRRVVEDAERRDLASLLVTFHPHPAVVVAPDRSPKHLQTRRQKLDSLAATGLTDLLVLEFTPELAALDGEAFFGKVLEPRIRFAAIHVGDNFRFGRERSGDVTVLRRIGKRLGFEVAGVPAVVIDGKTVSSTAIRRAVEAGKVEEARRMLGRPFALIGEVIPGEGRGADLQFPTANVAVENEMIPAAGVYVTETLALASRFPSVTNVGTRPTFHGKEVTVESHLIDFEGDLYTERVEIRFLARIRDEMRFSSGVELGDQIARDKAAAEGYFENMQLGSMDRESFTDRAG
jgi:riboflavin kinase/FMN adenylyltransferase